MNFSGESSKKRSEERKCVCREWTMPSIPAHCFGGPTIRTDHVFNELAYMFTLPFMIRMSA